jgi:alcohol dehydrogenase
MRAIEFDQHGPFENLVERDIPMPQVAPDECLVRVRAVSLNGFDPMVMRGIPGLRTPLPMIPGADVSGVIETVCPEAEAAGLHVGMRVGVNPSQPDGMMGETKRGGLCEFIAVRPEFLLPVPDAVSDRDAACLPTAYATAYRMLHARGQLQAGERVLILGASGGVGTCCIQLAKAAGAEVVAVTSSEEKGRALKALGADHVVDASRETFVDFVWQTYGKPRTRGQGGGVDICVNYSGGDHWAESFRAVRQGGRIVTCGATAGYNPPTDIRYIWSFEHTILGSNGWKNSDHLKMLDLIAGGKVRPVIDRVIDMGEVMPALRDLHDRRVVGKVVLEVGPK